MKTKSLILLFLLVLLAGCPNNIFAYDEQEKFGSAIEHFKNGDYSKSVSALNELVSVQPQKGLYWFNLGNAYFMLGNFERAAYCYIKVIKLKSRLSIPARLYLAKTYRNAQRLDYALISIRPLFRVQLPRALSEDMEEEKEELRTGFFALGMESYGNKRYADSIRHFDSALALGPYADAKMMKAFALLKLGRIKEAKGEFEEMNGRAYEDIADDDYRSDAKYFLSQINEGKWEKFKPYWLYADFWAGYDSNVYKDGLSESGYSKPMLQASLGAGYRFFENGDFAGRLAYNFDWQEFLGLSYLRLISNKGRLPVCFDDRKWRVQLEPSFQHEFLDFSSFLFRTGVSFTVERNFGRQRIGLDYDYIRNLSVLTDYDYLSGNVHSASLYWQYRERRYMIGPYAAFYAENIGDLPLTTGTIPLSNISFGPGLNGWWEFTEGLRMHLGTVFLLKYYDGRTTPSAEIRRDKYLNSHVKIVKSVLSKLEVFIESDFRINWSTLGASSIDDKNYRQFIVFGGISWNILP